MKSRISHALTGFYETLQDCSLLSGVSSLLAWDQSVLMPPKGAAERAQQRALISSLIHKQKNDTAFLEAVDFLAEEIDCLSDEDAVNIRESKRDCDRLRKIPESFVKERTHASAEAYGAWVEARPKNDFKALLPKLEKLFELNRQEAEYVGYETEAYDALLDKFEPGAKVSEVQTLIEGLCLALKQIIPEIQKKQGVRPSPLAAPREIQEQIGKAVSAALGFSYDSGRLDPTAHPFASTMGVGDYRITTRYRENDLLSSLYCTLHESGHALYEIGLPDEHRGKPLGDSISSGIHESQSLLWEDVVGRSHAFLEYLAPLLREHLSQPTSILSADTLWNQLNHIEARLIRVEADEVSYSLHIALRFELELALLRGDLKIRDLPDAWNEKYSSYLDLEVPDMKDGVLQDVHWFLGAVGYFPTYALGKLYAAKMYASAKEEMPNLEDEFSQGNFTSLVNWLREKVHVHGKRFSANELIEHVCGSPLSIEPFLEYVSNKFSVDTQSLTARSE